MNESNVQSLARRCDMDVMVGLLLLTVFAGLHHAGTGRSRADLLVVTLLLGAIIVFTHG
jgi:hypothetical protein